MQEDQALQESVDSTRAFGERFKAFRTKEGLTQPEVADMLNVKRQTVASWEQGLTAPDLKTLFLLKARLRQVYGLEVDIPELLGERQHGDRGSAVDIIIRLLQRIGAMGVQDIHPTRSEALAAFCPYLEREQKSICIVSSSFLGVTRVAPARVGEILQAKAGALKKNFKVLLTHPSRSDSRERQEGRAAGSILKEIEESVSTLRKWGVDDDSIKFYNGTPTIFLMFTPTRMLANPYTYEAEAFKTVTFELSAAKAPGSASGIYEQYREHHFQHAWDLHSQPLREVPEFGKLIETAEATRPAPKKRS